jgi:hypothetical protein
MKVWTGFVLFKVAYCDDTFNMEVGFGFYISREVSYLVIT